MLEFTYQTLPARVVFGPGRIAALREEVERLGARRALVLSTPGKRALAEDAARPLGPLCAGILARAVMHVPVEIAAEGRAEARRLQADCYVAIGGGTTIGLAKGIALETGMPIVAIPTTYSGSEVTPVQGLTEGGVKRTVRDPKLLPKTVIYDPELTLALPPAVSGPSGINAIAHCVEALYAQDANPITSLMAEEGIRALGASLPLVVQRPDDLAARAQALYGAWLAGTALGTVGMALHHKLCHTLGGSFNLPHAETHTLILPQAAAYNRSAAPEAMARIARALGAADAPSVLFDLAQRLGAEMRLSAFGLSEADLDRAADLALETPYPNPAPITREGVRALLQDAYEGRRPGVSNDDRSLHLRRGPHPDRPLRRRARGRARRRPRGRADQGAARAPPGPRPGRARRRDPRLRQPGRRGQPQRRPHGAAARRACPRACRAPPSTACAARAWRRSARPPAPSAAARPS